MEVHAMARHWMWWFFRLSVALLSGAPQLIQAQNTVPYFQGFEFGPAGWTTGFAWQGAVGSSWALGTPTKQIISGAPEGSNAWVSGGLAQGQYYANETSWVESPFFNFGDLTEDPWISLSIWREFADNDGATVQSSTNGGSTWTTVSPYQFGYTSWYTSLGRLQTPPSYDGRGWGSSSGGWVNQRAPLSGLAGFTSVKLRIALASDGTTHSDGLGFDAVSIFQEPVNVVPGCASRISPLQETSLSRLGVKFEWERNEGTIGLPYGYKLYIGTSDPPTNVLNGINTGTFTNYYVNILQENTIHYWKVVPIGVANIEAVNCPVWSFQTETVASISQFPYLEDFEGGTAGWKAVGRTSSWAFGTPLKNIISGAASGANSWVTGGLSTKQYNRNEQSWVHSPRFDLASFTVEPEITLKVWWTSEKDYDRTALQASTDRGITWVTIGGLDEQLNWYNSNPSYSWFGSSVGWSGLNTFSSGGWKQARTYKVTGLAGQQNVEFRIAFGSNGCCVGSDGFAFDDFSIYPAPADQRPTCALLVNPADAAQNAFRYNMKLEWDSSDPNPLLPYGYKLYVGTNNPPTNILNGIDMESDISLDLPQLNHSSLHYWKVVPYGVDQLEALSCPVWTFTTSAPVTASLPYFEDFESGPGNWVALGSTNTWVVGTPNKKPMLAAYSGSTAWVTGTTTVLDSNENGWIQSPVFNFSSLSEDPFISLFLESDFSPSSGCTLEYSADAGATWQAVGTIDPTWYNTYVFAFNGLGYTSNPPGWGYSNDLIQWRKYQTVLSGVAGLPEVELRIFYAAYSYSSAPQRGIAVDDISVFSASSEAASCAVPVYPADAASDVSLFTTKLEWSSNDPVIGLPFGCTISIGTDNPPTNIVANATVGLNNKYYFTAVKEENTVHYWRVVPHGFGSSTHAQKCPVWAFTTVSSPVINSFPYKEDFETASSRQWGSVPDAFTFNARDATTWALGTPSKEFIEGAYSGSNAWVVGTLNQQTPSPEYSFLRSPKFDLTSLVDPYVSLQAWWRSTDEYDGGTNMQYSINGGAWNVVSTTGTYWYNQYYTSVGEGWSDHSQQWTHLRAPLNLGGSSVVEFRFAYYTYSKQEGIAIDDIQIFEKPVGILPTCAELKYPPNGAEISNFNLQLQWESNDPTPGLPFGYNLRVWTNSSEVLPQQDVGLSTNYNVAKGQEGIVHFWQVIPYDPDNLLPENCPVWHFTTTISPTIAQFPYLEDFEDGPANWNIQGARPSWSLGTPNKAVIKGAASGANAFVTGGLGRATYNSDEASWVESPRFDFSALDEDPVAILKVWWESESTWDGAILQISLDDGAQWSTVGEFGESDNWYNYDVINGLAQFFSVPFGWSGYQGFGSAGWVTAVHSLTGTAQEASVTLRVAFAADVIIHSDGFAFDDFTLLPANLYEGAYGVVPQCAQHNMPITIGLSPEGVTLQWITDDPNSLLPFGLRVLFGPVNPPTATAVVSVSHFETGELLPNTMYYWQVVPLGLFDLPAQGCQIWNFTTGEFNVTEISSEESTFIAEINESSDSIISTPLIAGIIGGVVFILCVVTVVVAILLVKRRRNNKENEDSVVMSTLNNSMEINPTTADYRMIPAILDPLFRNSVDMSAATTASWLIAFNELQIQGELGKGAYGIVYAGKWRGQRVAVKQIRQPDGEPLSQAYIEDFQKEAAVMKGLRPHANCVLLLGVTLDPLCIVTEYVDCGSLFGYLRDNIGVPLDVKLEIVRGVVSGMLHLHSEKIVHRDLAARNVLLTRNLVPKISDFGMSRRSDDGNRTKSDTGPLKWMAPESINARDYSWASDVWSFGVLLFEIYQQEEPYPGLDPVQVATRVVSQGLKPDCPSTCPPILANIMDRCCSYAPQERPTFYAIYEALETEDRPQHPMNTQGWVNPGYTSAWSTPSNSGGPALPSRLSTPSTSGGPPLPSRLSTGPPIPPRVSTGFPTKSPLPPPFPLRTPTHSRQQLP